MCVVKNNKGVQHKTAVKVAFIDENGKILLDEIIKPALPVVDYKFEYTGLTEADLQEVTYTRQNAVRDVLQIVSKDANNVVVGHGLFNDFRALNVSHLPIIDTATLYCGLSDERATVQSLRSLGKQWLDVDLGQQRHDPAADAKLALDLVKYACFQGIKPWIVQKSHFQQL
eukprot:TRINITY_DN3527_c0_g1_i3.p2 TRINITY_DN3527_c0_g1~~TRINITY_DN3527_c0_g1_i3.p2  ORF type:complete len:171 (-),score=32.31 TRINITY_DN3527_c0_g1_i3:208-720(-)